MSFEPGSVVALVPLGFELFRLSPSLRGWTFCAPLQKATSFPVPSVALLDFAFATQLTVCWHKRPGYADRGCCGNRYRGLTFSQPEIRRREFPFLNGTTRWRRRHLQLRRLARVGQQCWNTLWTRARSSSPSYVIRCHLCARDRRCRLMQFRSSSRTAVISRAGCQLIKGVAWRW